MQFARVFIAASACVVLAAGAAACSGSFGSATNGPVPLGSLGPNAAATPTSPPTSSTVVLTYGESTAFQNLPEVAGYSGAIAFPKAPPATPGPKSSAAANAEQIAVGATFSVTKPDDGPDLNFAGGKGKGRKTRELPARALAYVKLLPTHDVTLESYPRIAIDIPREIAAQYRDGEFGLALWNSGTKDSAYRLSVAERDVTSSPPPIVRPSAAAVTPPPTPSPTPTPSPVASGAPGALSFPRPPSSSTTPVPSASPTLPPQRVLFAGTATPLKLVANRPAIFALYALPHPATSPTARASTVPSNASTVASPSASAVPSASAAGVASPSPSAQSSPRDR
jgi:hypothetical protein